MAAIRHLKVVGPANKKCTVALPVRKPNAAYRTREHLTAREVERLVEAAKDNRWGHRDATMVLLAFRHGLRASELVDLRWEQVDLENAISCCLNQTRTRVGWAKLQRLKTQDGVSKAEAQHTSLQSGRWTWHPICHIPHVKL
jgi:integrase